MTVSFAESRLEVLEGTSLEVDVRYRIVDLAEPLSLALSPLGATAEEEDYELSATHIELPAGQGVEGAAQVSLTARADRTFAEGRESLLLRFVPPTGIRAELGGGLEIVITDAGAEPCDGIALRAEPPVPADEPDRIAVTFLSDWRPGAADVQIEWSGPYGPRLELPWVEHHPLRLPGIARPNQPDFHIEEWRIEPDGASTRHVMSVDWPADAELTWRFRSRSGACNGEPVARCRRDGCELAP